METCVFTPRTPPDSPGSSDRLDSESSLESSDAVPATYQEAMERVNRSTDEVMHGVILGDTDDRNNDACQVNHSLNKENLTAHGMIGLCEGRARQAVGHPSTGGRWT